jgi:DNA-binding IclR family transcriptional regulator
MEPNSAHIAVVHRALTVLEELAGAGTALSFTQLCERTEIPKATLHRLLSTLEARGYVTQENGNGHYAAGVRCFELGSLWAQQLDLRAVAAPVLVELNAESQETVHLGVYDHGDVVYIDKYESPRQVIAKSHVGRRCDAVCVATGRVLLAHSEQAEIERVLSQPLPRYTEHSITDPGELRRMLQRVRAEGYAVNQCSYRDEVCGIAAPVRDQTGRVVASVGLCMPEHRFTTDRFDDLRDMTLRAGVEVSRRLGGPATVVTSEPASAP